MGPALRQGLLIILGSAQCSRARTLKCRPVVAPPLKIIWYQSSLREQRLFQGVHQTPSPPKEVFIPFGIRYSDPFSKKERAFHQGKGSEHLPGPLKRVVAPVNWLSTNNLSICTFFILYFSNSTDSQVFSTSFSGEKTATLITQKKANGDEKQFIMVFRIPYSYFMLFLQVYNNSSCTEEVSLEVSSLKKHGKIYPSGIALFFYFNQNHFFN